MEKKKISAKEFIEDIRFGLDDSTLIEKYKISSKDKLTKYFDKLVDTGHLTKTEIDRRYKTVICPSCGETHFEEIVECQYCGVIVTKYVKKVKRDYAKNVEISTNNIRNKIKEPGAKGNLKESTICLIEKILQIDSNDTLKKILSLCLFVVIVFGYKIISNPVFRSESNNQSVQSEIQNKTPSKAMSENVLSTPNDVKSESEESNESFIYYDFRKIQWGMSKSKVMKMESSKLVCDNCTQYKAFDSILGYETTVANKEVGILYYFINDEVVRAVYAVRETHTNKNKYIEDYNDFKSLLRSNYGKPKVNKEVWSNDLYKDMPEEWGMAVSIGHLQYLAQWETSSTIIINMLTGDNFKVNCMIVYDSIEHRKIVKDRERKARRADL